MARIAAQPQAIWLTGAATDAEQLARVTTEAQQQGRLPTFVLYNIPFRDCVRGQGASGVAAYEAWIEDLIGALDGREALFVLEPDALAGIGCLDAAAARVRLDLLRAAVRALRDGGGLVYLDAGHSRWQTSETMVERLRAAGISDAHGFSVNVANTVGEAESHEWATAVAREVQRGFIVDTGRSGAGARSQWCNPLDAALGDAPVIRTQGWRDALLWIKRPGESDGPCNGGPAAGTWWPEYAVALARAAE